MQKIHASTGQTVAAYRDPETGQPLNFNFLPYYADPRLGVMPHTVQHYALDDVAPTYGNQSFAEIYRFMRLAAPQRPTVWHPETAYWVSFDIDVPLFLPLYAERRFHDLWLLACDQAQGRLGAQGLAGQLVFSSGWEWGYWLNDVIAARSAWHGVVGASEAEAWRARLQATLALLGGSDTETAQVVSALTTLIAHQQALLTDGKVGGHAPHAIVRRNGIAYLQGFEAWDDVADALQAVPGAPHIAHQPDRLGLVEMRNPVHAAPSYAELAPLLGEMATTFQQDAQAWQALAAYLTSPGLREVADEFARGTQVLALRARQQAALYAYVDLSLSLRRSERAARLSEARTALDTAMVVVRAQEANYRLQLARLAAWQPGPTAYEFGYLWTVHSLYYFWRDEAKATEVPLSPCYLNIIHGLKVGFGEGRLANVGETLRRWGEGLWGVSGLTACLAAPASAPELTPATLRR